MKMRTSWKKRTNAEMGVGTMIIFIAMVLVAAVAASVLITTANKVREQAQNTGDQAVNNVASGFFVQDVTGTVNSDRSSINSLDMQIRLQAGSPAINMDGITVQYISGSSNDIKQLWNEGLPITFSGASNVYNGSWRGDFFYHIETTASYMFYVGEFTGTIDGIGPYHGGLDGTILGNLSGIDNAEYLEAEAHPNVSRSFDINDIDIQGMIRPDGRSLEFFQPFSGAPTTSDYIATQTLAKDVGGATWSAGNHVVQQGDMITISISNGVGNLNLGFAQSVTIKIAPAYGTATVVNFMTPSYYDTDYVNLK